AAAPGPASERPFLGVEVSQARRGLRVEAVRPQGPAAAAGIEVGDVLHGIGDAPVATLDDLQRVLAKHRVGERVTITVERDGSDRRLDLELGSRGRPAVASVDGPAAAVLAPARDGLRVERAGDL